METFTETHKDDEWEEKCQIMHISTVNKAKKHNLRWDNVIIKSWISHKYIPKVTFYLKTDLLEYIKDN